jgi:hypothetical protein
MLYYSEILEIQRAESAKSKSGLENQMHKILRKKNKSQKIATKSMTKNVSIFIKQVKDTELQKKKKFFFFEMHFKTSMTALMFLLLFMCIKFHQLLNQ